MGSFHHIHVPMDRFFFFKGIPYHATEFKGMKHVNTNILNYSSICITGTARINTSSNHYGNAYSNASTNSIMD